MKLAALAAFAGGAGVLAILVVRAGLPAVASSVAALGLAGLLIVSLVHLPVIVLLGHAWRSVAHGSVVPQLSQFAWARALRDAVAETLPFAQLGGYFAGARALCLHGAEERTALAWTLADYIAEFAAKLPYMLVGLFLLEFIRPHPLVMGTLIVSLGICALLAIPKMDAMLWRLLRERLSGAVPNAGRLRNSLGWHLLCWLIGAAEAWLMFRLMHLDLGLGPALAIDSSVGAIRALSFFVPAAVGVQEGSYVLLCGVFGISPAAALAFSFARRARDLFIALPVLWSWQWREARLWSTRRPRVS
jgi:hypothetical protein